MINTPRLLTSPLGLGAIVFALALALRLEFVCVFHSADKFVVSDMWVYDHRAHNLLSGNSSAWDTFTPVGYPAFVAAVYALGGGARAIGVLQALLGAATAGLGAVLALRSFGRPLPALVVGVACALHLPGVLYTGFLLTETLCAFLVVCACWLLAFSVERRGRGALLGSAGLGLVLGAAATVRPNLLLFMPWVPLLLWLGCERSWRRALPALALVIGGFLLPVAPALVHNSRLLGRPASLGTNGGLNFYLNLAEVRGVRYRDRYGVHRITPIPNLLRHPRDEDEEVVAVPFYDDAHYYARGLALLRERPERVLNGARNLVEAAGIGEQGYWPVPEDRLTHAHRRAFFSACLVPSLAGALLLASRRRWAAREHLPLLAALGFVSANLLTLIFFLGDPRLRVPFDPLFLLLAAGGYLWIGELLQEHGAALLGRRRRHAPPAARRPSES